MKNTAIGYYGGQLQRLGSEIQGFCCGTRNYRGG